MPLQQPAIEKERASRAGPWKANEAVALINNKIKQK